MSSLAIRKVNIKATMKYHFVCTSMSVIKKIISVGEKVEKLEPLYTAHGKVKWCSHLKNNFAVPQSVKHGIAPCQQFTPRCTPKRTENVGPHKHLYANVHSIIIHNRQKVGTTKVPSAEG